MADYEAALVARLRAAGPVVALVGNRVDWDVRPQGDALPAITLSIVTDGRAQLLNGFDPLQFVDVQVDCWTVSAAQRRAVREAVIAALIGPFAVGSVQFQRATVTTRAGIETVGTKQVFRASCDFRLPYTNL